MAVGDLVVADYGFEYNGLLIGAGTDYDLQSISNFLGFSMHTTTTVAKFGRHGDSPGRHFANSKKPTFIGNIKADNATDFAAKRTAFINAFAPIVDPNSQNDLVVRLPDAAGSKYKVSARPIDLEIPLERAFTRMYAPYTLRFEQPDPRIYSLTATTRTFNISTGAATETIPNAGNADAKWIAELIGPCDSPVLTHEGTGQSLGFAGLSLASGEALVYDSSNSTVKVNGVSVGNAYTSGFSWFNLGPGNNDITITASNSSTASFSLTWNDAYWMI